ncbi:MAG TPA: glycoside hydrolase family 38 C-terminal domain-containing protein [Bacteroidota bacterium]|nr:glycoside hydrolase family 38 C-terminal domain-containing protein [Bacteroidota bacterium]
MKPFITISLLLLATAAVSAQTNVDRLVRALDSLGTVSYDNWRVSPDLKNTHVVTGDPTQPGFDDSKWDTLRLNQSIYPDSVWLRKEIVLPDRILGRPVSGTVRVLLSVDDYGYLWVNGADKGYFPWDGEFTLTDHASPGEKFLLVIKAINTGGPLRLIRAKIESGLAQPVHETITDLSLSLRTGQKLLSFDTYQTNAHKKVDPRIDKSTSNREEKMKLNALLQSFAEQVDIHALGEGDLDKFSQSVDAVRTKLAPIAEYAKRFTLFLDANAHIDAAWLWRDKETIEVCHNTFGSVLNMMDAKPDFTYTQSAAAYYDWMERLYPDIFRRIKQRVEDGRWEVVGGMWVEPDCNLPSGESWMHHLLYSERYFKNKLGVKATIGYNPDSFGYNLNMPEFYANAGIDAFITQKMGWSETNVFPYRVFWWESPDGSRILNYFPFDYVNSVDDPYGTVDQLRQFEANTGFKKQLILFGVGDHGGGPTPEMLDRVEHLRRLDIYPKIEYGTIAQYLTWLRSNDLSALPVWKDELYLEYHQGCYTTQSETKAGNRKSEVLLTNAEKFSALATLAGRPYGGSDLESAWRNVLFNQFHDILPGSGIRENYIDAAEKYRTAETIGRFNLNGALTQIAEKIPTRPGTNLVVFNPLGWNRSGIAAYDLAEGDTAGYAVIDPAGREVPSQVVRTGIYTRRILFRAGDVPSVGYSTYQLRKAAPSAGATDLKITRSTIENALLRVTIDTSTGLVGSIVDKKTGREILAGGGNELQLLEDLPAQWDAWNIGLTGRKYPLRLRSIDVLERGPVRATIRIATDMLKPGIKKDVPTPDYPSSFFTQDVTLESGSDIVRFTVGTDWWEDKTMIKVAFPVAVADTAATYEIPYGTIRRSTGWRTSWDSARVEVSAQRWADLSQDDYGVSLLNDSKYGYDIKGNVMRLSLLRSPKWPDPTADRGKHTIEYALYPHAGRWYSAQTVRRGYEFNTPLLVTATGAHKGDQPPARSFIRLEPASMVLSVVKQAEDSRAWIVQWYNTLPSAGEAALTLPKKPAKVFRSDFLEEEKEALRTDGPTIKVPTPKSGVVTLRIEF